MSENRALPRPNVPNLDAILGVAWEVLDDGFVRVVDYMGDDNAVVQAARVSYGGGTRQLREDRALLRYLMRHRHTSPFEMCEIKLHVRVPMDTWRQWIRHRTASVNEYSTRYSVAINRAQTTAPSEWREQSVGNRQGSGGKLSEAIGNSLSAREHESQILAREVYEERLNQGVAREQARKDLPLSTYTEAFWKTDLHNLLHFLSLRMDDHAQLEIRSYAQVIGHKIVSVWCPWTWQAFLDYRMESIALSAPEAQFVAAISGGDRDLFQRIGFEQGWTLQDGTAAEKSRERVELEEKLKKLGIMPPWRAR